MVSLLSLSGMQWDQETVQVRNAGFPTGATRRLESRRYGDAAHRASTISLPRIGTMNLVGRRCRAALETGSGLRSSAALRC